MKGEGIPRIPAGAAWMLPLLLAVTVAGVGLWADSVARSVVESRVRDQLRLALDANARAVDLWMESQEAMVRLVAENPRVQAFAGEIVAASHKPGLTDDALRTGPEQLEFRSLVMSAGLSRGQGGGSLEGVVGVALAEPAGRILAALHPARVGIRHEAFADEAILRVLGGEALVLHPQRTTQRRGVGDGSGTPPSSWPLGRVVTGAVAGQPGVDTQGYRDYRGVNVVGAWTWLDRHALGLVTKLDRAEAYATLAILRRAFGSLLALLALCAVGFAAYTRVASRLGRDLRKARKLGHYTLQEKVGEGGMGTVYRARHALLRRSTAIKLIHAGKASPRMLARFEREVQITSQLTHPNTIAVFDYGRSENGTFYYAMEYLDGVALDRLVAGEGALETPRALHILRQLCGSLAEAHALGLIHRDIKPGNVMLCVRGLVYDFVKVLDFGLAKEAGGTTGDGSLTNAGELTGTPLYMAPEMIRTPEQAGPASDVYAVGALAYYLVTGTQAFSGSSVVDILGKHLNEAPEPPSKRTGRGLDRGLERLLLRCLEKDPSRRPADARELLAELEKVGTDERPWTQAEARAWWETRAASYRRSTPGQAPTGGPELEIELLDRISTSGVKAIPEEGTMTRVKQRPPASGE